MKNTSFSHLTLLASISQNGQTHSNDHTDDSLSVFDHFVGLALKRLNKKEDSLTNFGRYKVLSTRNNLKVLFYKHKF